MANFLKPLENVDGFTLKEPTGKRDSLCPVCQGYGGWNLRLNAYGQGVHFKSHCSQCNGWGWVLPEDLCVHTFRELSQTECRERHITHWGTCWHVYECTICGRINSVDSSD
jgi:DnaJ-class molecular chaperone